MIYDFPAESEPIRQGDIFFPLPYLILNDPMDIHVINEQGEKTDNWNNIGSEEKNYAIVPMVPVCGIVATQDCDAIRKDFIIFFKVEPFDEASGLVLPAESNVKSWVNLLIKEYRFKFDCFYLPLDKRIGFVRRMGVDFDFTFLIQREYLEINIGNLRKGRLNETASQHFREKISEYFRRFPYDEWYPMTKVEFEFYKERREAEGDRVDPYTWQE